MQNWNLMASSTVNLQELRDRYVRMQLAGDRRAALQFVEEALSAGIPAAVISTRIVAAAQREIGRLWQENRISIAQEHMATAISQVVLAQVFGHAEFRARVGRKILVACVPGEHHDFPARLLADALDLAGYDVRFLGADVPLEALARMVGTEQPDLLALSVTMLFNLQSLRETLRAVRKSGGDAVPIAVGGHAVSESGACARELGVELVATDAETFVPEVDRLLGVVA
jgi:MerR family transcriptional regulator, light-induced transcriptional regulator